MTILKNTIAFLCAALVLAGCEKAPSTQATSPPTATESAPTDPTGKALTVSQTRNKPHTPESSFLTPDRKDVEKARAHIREMRDRKACNRVMGCPASIALAGMGPATEVAIIEVLKKNKGSDGYWVIRCIDLLGQLGRSQSGNFLVALLSDKRTEVRTRAALALARLADPSTKDAVKGVYEDTAGGPDLGFKIALLYAIDRIGPFSVERRKMVATLLPQDKDGLGRISPLHLITAAEVAKEWPIPEALPTLRVTAAHIGPFIRRNSIDALGRMKDTGAIPVLIARMKDTVPSIRRAAMNALRAITGNGVPQSESDWLAWCDKRQCRKAPSTVD